MINLDTKDAERQMARLRRMATKEEVRLAGVRAVSHTMQRVRVQTSRAIRQEYNIGASATNQNLRAVAATKKREAALLYARSARMSLANFKPMQVGASLGKRTFDRKTGEYKTGRISANRGSGVLVEIIKGKPQLLRGAFFLPNNKAPGVPFARGRYNAQKEFEPNKARYPITPLTTLSVFTMARAQQVQQASMNEAKRRLPGRMKHELVRILRTR